MMKNKEQKMLQDWIDTLQGVAVRGIDIKTRLEARLLRNAWIAENKKIENEIPDQDDVFYQNIREAIAKRKAKKSSDLWASFFENKLKALLIVILGTGFVYASKKTYDGVVSVADELNHIILAKETGNKMIVNRTNDKGFWDEHFDRHGGFTGFWSRYTPSKDEKIVPENVDDNLCSYNATLTLENCLALANQYDANARFNLGLIYELGVNVDQNYLQAYEWYKKSSALGNEDARSNMEYLIKKGLVY
jgi:TPR repeat protein